MMGNSHRICRLLLKIVMQDVVKYTTVAQRKAAWGHKTSGIRTVEFHGPDGFYWTGQGCCLWATKANGWMAWLERGEEQ